MIHRELSTYLVRALDPVLKSIGPLTLKKADGVIRNMLSDIRAGVKGVSGISFEVVQAFDRSNKGHTTVHTNMCCSGVKHRLASIDHGWELGTEGNERL